MDKKSLKPGHLRRIKSLALLEDGQLAAFLNYIEVLNLSQSAILFYEGQPGDSMFLILEGQLRVFIQKRNNDQPRLLRMLEAGDAFGEIALLTQAPRSATVEVTQNCVLIKVSPDALQRLVTEQPSLAAQFLFQVAKTLGRLLNDTTTKLRIHSEQTDVLSGCL
jgi:CRP/FNR family transcriptional regulator